MQKYLILITCFLCCIFTDLRAGKNPPASLSGTYLVGSGQPVYKKLTDVAAVLNNAANTVTGDVIFELDSDYDGTTGETFPLSFNQFSSSGNWTVTIRPKAGVSMRTTSGEPGANALITLDGADRLILDGRAGGTGGINWLIRNTRIGNALAAILLQNDAQYNTLTYLQLEGEGRVIYLGSTVQTQGNDNNMISYCDIRDRSDVAGRPVIGILSGGATSDTTRFNSGNTIVYNNIFNFYNSGGPGYGVNMGPGTTRSLVAHNNFFQTQPYIGLPTGTTVYAVYVNEVAAANTIVSDNFIGGSAPQCGGDRFSFEGAGIRFNAITFDCPGSGTGKGNIVNNNTIRNFAISSSRSPISGSFFTGVQAFDGQVDVTNNTIGNPDGNDDIKLGITGGTATFYCTIINFTSDAGGSIIGNKIGGFTITISPGITGACTFNAINAGLSSSSLLAFPISDNIVGSTTVNDNIRTLSAVTPVHFNGILTNISGGGGVNCKKNTIAGVSLAYSGTTTPVTVTPINLIGSPSMVADSNLISDISSASLVATDPDNVTFAGISMTSGTIRTISNNTIRRLRLTGTAIMGNSSLTSSSVCGIYMPAATAGTARIYNNRLYGFTSTNMGVPPWYTLLTGMEIRQSATIYNNMIALTNGPNTNNCEIRGIRLYSSLAINVQILHNTIDIGGSNIGALNGALSSVINRAAINKLEPGPTVYIRNNVLVNERKGTYSNNAIFINIGPNWPVTGSDYNLVVIDSLSKIGYWGFPLGYLDSAEWKTIGGDVNSSFYTTMQIAPSDLFPDITTCDLSIKDSTRQYVAGLGTGGTGIATDYAGIARHATKPSAGAYEYRSGTVSNAPAITSYGGSAAVTLPVPENTTMVTTVTATDADAGTTLVYSLGGGEDAAKFKVDSSTGVLSFITAPDFEQPGDANGDNAYIVAVQVSDGDSTAVQRFKIKVTDANDHAPVITSYNGDAAVTLRVEENTATVIATVKATDVDKNTTITYSLVNEEDAAKFIVNSSTGDLKFITAPDFDQPGDTDRDNVYVVTVKASDGDSSAVQRFKIKVTNVNDNTPVITSHNGLVMVSLQLPENTQLVTTVRATDADSTAIVYSIVDGQDGALFAVNASTGVLSFITPPDYEHLADGNTDNIYQVLVKASDGSLSAIQQFYITITDLNDNPPVVTMTVKIPENTVEVTPLEGTDEDAGSTVTFSILNKEDGALFRISSGILEFITAPDFEHPADANGDNIYIVSVKMTNDSVVTILRFQIKATDADESAGRTAGRGVTVPEVQPTVVLQMEASTEPGRGINVYPNPVTGKRFTLRMDSIAAGRYTLELYTTAGQLVCRQLLNHAGKFVIYPVQLPASLTRGVYVMKLTGANTAYTEKLFVE